MKNIKVVGIFLVLCLAFAGCKTPLSVPLTQQKRQQFGQERMEFIGFKNMPAKNKILQDFGAELERSHIAVNRQDFYMGVYSLQELEVYKPTMRYISFVDIEKIASTYNDAINDNQSMAVWGWFVAGLTVFTLPMVYVPMIVCAKKNECQLSVSLKGKLYVYDTLKKEVVLTSPIDYNWAETYKGQYLHKETNRDAINDSDKAKIYNELLDQYVRAYNFLETLDKK